MRVESRNVDVAKRLWEAAAMGDAGSLARAFSDDIVWYSYGQNPMSGEFRGRDAVIAQIARLADHVDDVRMELQDIFVSAHGAVIHYALWARRAECVLDTDFLLRLHIEAGEVTECHVIPVDQQLTNDFLNWNH